MVEDFEAAAGIVPSYMALTAIDAATGLAAALHDRLNHLANSDAALCLVTLEDLWLETRPQNVPGTVEGNWQRPLAKTLDDIASDHEIDGTLNRIAALRRNLKA